MKTSLAIIVILAANTQAIKIRYSPESVDKYIIGGRDCAKEESVDPFYLPKLNDINDFPSHENIRCLNLCMMKKFELVDSDLHFLSKKFLQFVDDPVIKEKLSQSLDKCTLIYKTMKSCDDAYDHHKCMLENMS